MRSVAPGRGLAASAAHTAGGPPVEGTIRGWRRLDRYWGDLPWERGSSRMGRA